MRLRRNHAALAALALVSVSVFGGALAAFAAPSAPLISPSIDGMVTEDSQVAIRGTVAGADGGTVITVLLSNAEVADVPYCVAHSEHGYWRCEPESARLIVGKNYLTATATDETGASDASATATVTRIEHHEHHKPHPKPTPPPTPPTDPPTDPHTDPPTDPHTDPPTDPPTPEDFSIDSPASGSSSSDPTPSFSGIGPALGTVHVTAQGPGALCSAPVAQNTHWSCTSAVALDPGQYSIIGTASSASSSEDPDPVHLTLYVIPAKPQLDYSVRPAGVTISGTNSGTVHIALTPPGGSAPTLQCPASAGGPPPCSFDSLGAGVWHIASTIGQNGQSSHTRNDYLRIPVAPVETTSVATNGVVTISGTGTAGDLVVVETPSAHPVCSTTVSSGGHWSCTDSPGTGSHSYRATQHDVGFTASDADSSIDGISGYSATRNVVVPSGTTTLAALQLPVLFSWVLDVSGLDSGKAHPGDTVTLSGSALEPGSTVNAELHSTVYGLGTTTVDPLGSFSLDAVIPLSVPLGNHTFVVTVTNPRGESSTVRKSVRIVADPVPPTPSTTNQFPTPSGVVLPWTGRNLPTAPSSFTNALNSIGDLLSNPAAIGTAGTAGLALLLFLALPAELLNSTISEHYERLTRRLGLRRLRLPVAGIERVKKWFSTSSIWAGLVVTLITALLFGFADPSFGFDLTSLRAVLAGGLALFVVNYVANVLTSRVAHNRWGVAAALRLKPLGLVLALLGVVVSRLLDFSPGFLVGLTLGIVLGGSPSVSQRARTALIRAAFVFGFSIAAWVAYSLLPDGGAVHSFAGALSEDTLVAITTEGLTALLIGLLPFRFLEGEMIFRESRVQWAIAYFLSATAFVAIVVPKSENVSEIGSSVWVWFVGGFAVLAVGIYLYFRFWATRAEGGEGEASVESEEPQRKGTTVKN